jgi:NAD(P)-dependent dehydrogenase (short-subunit alcohol dehydrogenase family)
VSRTVVITGGGSGIGAATAQAFAAAGDCVFVCDISAERAEGVVEQIGADARAYVLDVSDESAVREAIRGAREATGRLDVVVNNAGIGDGQPDIVETPTELWRRVLDINLSGSFYAAREAAAIMLEQRAGRIINVASISTFSGRANGVPYTVSKAGIFGMTQRLAHELGPHGITVNAILPGAISTGIWENTQEVLADQMPPPRSPAGSREQMLGRIPAGRPGTAEEVASAIVYLASKDAAYVNGVALPVDGGWLSE